MLGASRLVVAALLVAGLQACGEDRLDPNAVAVAKCGLPLSERLHVPTGITMERRALRVTTLENGRRKVTGEVALPEKAFHPFTCIVAPDPSDKLRGLRIESLVVEGIDR